MRLSLQDKAGVMVAFGEKIDAAVVDGLSALRVVAVSAAGYNNIDVPALTRAGIIATNSPGPADETVADFTWGLLIATARKLVEGSFWIRDGNWTASSGSRFFGSAVSGSTLGIIGMGRIGQSIARRAPGFNMRVLYYNRHRLDVTTEESCRSVFVTKDEILVQSDFLVLALPYSPEPSYVIGAEELKKMKSSSILLNIARGGLVDEIALADALINKRIAAAGLDVFENEPAIHPALLNLSNVVLTPHIAGATEATQHGLADLAADNLIAALGLGPNANQPPSILNPEVLKK